MDGEVKHIELDRLNLDCQTRSELRENAIEEYAEVVRGGAELDPGLAIDDGKQLYLAAGYHRCEAYRRAGRKSMPCVVCAGSRWDAIQAGINDNRSHRGERISNADKQHNVQIVLRERHDLSDRAIAALVEVDHRTVSSHRIRLESTGEIPQSRHRTGLDGRAYRAPIAVALETAWSKYPLPELEPDRRYIAAGLGEQLVTIDPHPESPPHCYVSHYFLGASPSYVVGGARGMRRDRKLIEQLLMGNGFTPATSWKAEGSTQAKPDWMSEFPLWEQWSVDVAKHDFYERHQEFPNHNDSEFWDKVESLLAEARAKVPDEGDRFGSFHDAWKLWASQRWPCAQCGDIDAKSPARG